MEMTARLGLKELEEEGRSHLEYGRNGDDSPVGIESGAVQNYDAGNQLSRNGDDSPVGIESSSRASLFISRLRSKWR